MNHVLHPSEVRIALRRYAVAPALVVGQPLATPIGDVERRVGEDVVRPKVGVAIIVEAVTVGDLALDASDGKVHLRQSPRRVVGFLAVDGAAHARPPLPFPVAWAAMNAADCTNMPDEPQQGSYTRPRYGSSISTSSFTTQRGV